MNWEIRIDICTPLSMEEISSESLPCSAGNSTRCSVVTWMDGREIQKGGDMCIHMSDSLLCAVGASRTL